MTSNPAIFEKSILGSADYDDDLKRLADEGKSAREIYRAMALHDVRAAADVLRPVYDRTGGVDGYVSWEVAPRLAHDTEGTLEQAHMYWDLVDRPNLMIKIPATEAGLPAIEQALFDGMNINVTLLFKVAPVRARDGGVHPGAWSAAWRPGGRWTATRSPRSSSRAWTPRSTSAWRRSGNTELQGRAGLANARAAYQAFQNVFEGERFAKLREAGLPGPAPAVGLDRRQEPGLPGDALRLGPRRPGHRQHDAAARRCRPRARRASVTGATAAEDPTADLQALADAGIDLEDVTDQLLREGIDAFMVPMQKLLDGIEAKRTAIAALRARSLRAAPGRARPGAARRRAGRGSARRRRSRPPDSRTARSHSSRGERQVVGDDQHRALDAVERLDQLAAGARVEVRARLVEHEQARVHRQHGGDRDAAALAEAELVRRAAVVLAHAHGVQRRAGRGPRPPAWRGRG